MQDIPLLPSDYRRLVAKEAIIPLRNRYAEQNPALNDSPVSLISRPGLDKLGEIGQGHVRKVYSSAGAFENDAFAVSGNDLFRIDAETGESTNLGTISTNPLGSVSMAATSPIGTEIPSYLFIAEGEVLWFFTDNGHARGILQSTGAISNGDEVRINDTYYEFTTGSVDTGSPDGSSGNPWLVDASGTQAESITNLANAIMAQGVPGTDYSTDLTVANSTVEVTNFTATDIFVQARDPGLVGNGYATTETGANLSWGAATLEGGGDNQLSQVIVPDSAGAISVEVINSFVIVVPTQTDELGTVGRFYWIEPGETTVDPLNFATAERSPDRINQVVVYKDMFWLFGDTTTEPWVTTGSQDFPMQRFQGILFDRGAWEGTAVKVRDNLIVVDEEGGVFLINNGQTRVSNPSIEERIRRAILASSASVLNTQ